MPVLLKSLFLPEGEAAVLFAAVGSPGLLAAYLLAVNLLAFLVFGWDKCAAKWKERRASVRRVPEKTLLLLSALGGSPGALLGMRVFRHKTLHRRFRLGVPLLLALQLAAAAALALLLR